MPKIKIRYVGLDVHKDTIAIAVAETGQGEVRSLGNFPSDWPTLQKHLQKIATGYSLKICYEAGPTGYNLYRRLVEAGYDCVVIAPSKVPHKPGDRVKTDRRDAMKLARCLRAGDLTPVYVPEPEVEALRDLERTRENAKKAEIAAKNQLSKFLLRYGIIWNEGSSWTRKHFEWLRKQEFKLAAQQIAYKDCLLAVEIAMERVERLNEEIEKIVPMCTQSPLIKALQALRGVQTLTAVILAAEIGDPRRFRTAGQFMAYVGLCPSENSSGKRNQKGPITKAGNRRVRRILIESAWHYRTPRTISAELRKRQEQVSPEVREIAKTAIKRLQKKFRHLLEEKCKNAKLAVVAIARELAGFIWAIGQEDKLLAT